MLTQPQINAAKPREKPYKLADERGLHLHVSTTGARSWRLKYRIHGVEKLLALGLYPDVSLKLARQKRDEARALVAAGGDPCADKKAERERMTVVVGNTVREIGEMVYPPPPEGVPTEEVIDGKPRRPYGDEHRRRLELYVYPRFGARPIASVTKDELEQIIAGLRNEKKLDLAQRVKRACDAVWTKATSMKMCAHNIVKDIENLKRSAKGRRRDKHYPSIQDPRRYGQLLRSIEGFRAYCEPSTYMMWQLLPHIVLRSSELRWARWNEIDFETREWRPAPIIMKEKLPHIIPLSRQVLEILHPWHSKFGHHEFVFPMLRSGRPPGKNTLDCALRAMGFPTGEMCPHGVRSFFSTKLHEYGWPDPAIEIQLAHMSKATPNKVAAAYNYAEYLPLRRIMAQWWSDYLDSLRDQTAEPQLPYAAIQAASAQQIFMSMVPANATSMMVADAA